MHVQQPVYNAGVVIPPSEWRMPNSAFQEAVLEADEASAAAKLEQVPMVVIVHA